MLSYDVVALNIVDTVDMRYSGHDIQLARDTVDMRNEIQ